MVETIKISSPVLLFDGDCGFCRTWVDRWRARTGDAIHYVPSQSGFEAFPDIPRETFQKAVVLAYPDGHYVAGARAVYEALALGGHPGWLWAARRIPGFQWASDVAYGVIAGHRSFFSRLTRLVPGPDPAPPSYFIARSVYLRLLGAAYLAAFVSLASQATGLFGPEGIAPVGEYLDAVRARAGSSAPFWAPTVFWLGTGDAALVAAAWTGAALSTLLIVGVLPAILSLILWALYLSFASIGNVFLSFQWDALLLEAGFLAIFLSPWTRALDARTNPPPPAPAIGLHRWLLFRLMFLSGAVKLLSADPSWRSFAALRHHFETQPLPNPVSWFVHHLPDPVLLAGAAFTFFVELVVPFFVFGPRRVRAAAFWLLLIFQFAVAATGNYTFFNLLSAALALFLLDDRQWGKGVAERHRRRPDAPARPARALNRVFVPVAALLIALSSAQFAARLGWTGAPVRAVLGALAWAAPFHLTSAYGLFAVMTTERPEIVIEGSADGETWRAYEFKHKPGDPGRRPAIAAPFQPRLDWQMWFAALSRYQANPWLLNFMGRLLQGSAPVEALLKTNPFPDEPPARMRAVLYDYRFSTPDERRRTGRWWTRSPRCLYCPVLALRRPDE